LRGMGRVLALVNQKGGCGKSTLAVGLAAYFAKRRPTLLIDADEQASASEWLGDSTEPRVIHVVGVSALERVLEDERRGRRLAVVDCPPFHAGIAAAALRFASLTLIPVVPSGLDVRVVAPLLRSMAEHKRPALVVLNRAVVRSTSAGEVREALARFGVPIARTVLHNRLAHSLAPLSEASIFDHAPRSKAAAEMLALAREVARTLEKV